MKTLTPNFIGRVLEGQSNFFKYAKEWHVDPVNGLDTNQGRYDQPFKTIAHAQSLIDESANVLFLHGGENNETVTWTKANVAIVGLQTQGLTHLSGNWTFSHSNLSVRVYNCSLTGTVTHSGPGDLYLNETLGAGAFLKSSSGYTELYNSDFASVAGFSVTGSGKVVVDSSKLDYLTVNNADAVVTLQNNSKATGPIAILGKLKIIDSETFSTGETGASVAGQAGATVIMRNSVSYKPDGSLAPVSFLGPWSVSNSAYDSGASVLTGNNLGEVSRFDQINARGYLSGSSLFISHNQARAFSAGVIVEKNNLLYKSNADIPADTEFVIGTTGATWQPLSASGTPITTSLTPMVFGATDYENAQANEPGNVADLIKLSNGEYINTGKVIWTNHGLIKGAWYFLSQDTAGEYVTPAPTTGILQKLFFVQDENTIHINAFGTGDGSGEEQPITVSGPIIDNTIKNPNLITVVGKYIVPDSETVGVFVGQENKYANWDGEYDLTDPENPVPIGFIFTAPVANDAVLINLGTNAGQVWTFDGTVWAKSSQTTGLSVYNWVLDRDYKATELVIKDSSWYQANANIPKNTAFAIGVTGATWKSINGGNIPADYIYVIRAINDQTGAGVGSTLTFNKIVRSVGGITYNPSNGVFSLKAGNTYRLEANVAFGPFSDTTNGYISFNWTDVATNTPLADVAMGIANPVVRNVGETSQTFAGGLYTPTTDQTIKLSIRSAAGTATLRFDVSSASITQVSANIVTSGTTAITESVTITGSTTSPTKSNAMTKDTITLIDDGSGWCTVDMELVFSNTGTGATAGSGTYLFTLPGNRRFDLTRHPVDNTTPVGSQIPAQDTHKFLPSASGLLTNSSLGIIQDATAVPRTATQFILAVRSNAVSGGAQSPADLRGVVGSSFFGLSAGSGGRCSYCISFRFKKA